MDEFTLGRIHDCPTRPVLVQLCGLEPEIVESLRIIRNLLTLTLLFDVNVMWTRLGVKL